MAHGSGKSYDIVTGAIADYGTDHDAGNNTQKIVLSKGTFELAAADFNKKFKTKVDKTTCAVVGSSHAANLRISHGTGAYAKITGSVAITGSFFEIAKKSASGKCDLNKAPISASVVITGTGKVSFCSDVRTVSGGVVAISGFAQHPRSSWKRSPVDASATIRRIPPAA